MTTITISELKVNPSAAIRKASDYPVAVENRNKVTAYLVGKQLFEKFIAYLEDREDQAVVAQADFSKAKDFESIARDLGI